MQQSGTHRAVSLLGHGWFPREEDELGVVLLQPLHVGLQGLCGLVPSAGVHGDSDGPGKLLVDAGELRGEEERRCQHPTAASSQAGESKTERCQHPTAARQGDKHSQHRMQGLEKGWASPEGPTTPPTKGLLVLVLKVLLGLIFAGGYPQKGKMKPLQDSFKSGFRQTSMSQFMDNSSSLNTRSSIKSGFFFS